mmetsp:Transcript_41954/g.37182  ORF Transcript_41954/g.37182 Transcript_41954/m.37182 type:complete len:265 (-) Transcript_41954:150-944(-)
MAEAEQKEQKLKLYANPICPFAQRAWLALEIKKVPYEYIKCDLREKPAFFTEAYQKALGAAEGSDGKVPVIETPDGKFITESTIVARYVDYVYSDESKYGPSLLPKDAFERAAVEIMIDWFGDSGWLRFHYGTLMQCDKEKADASVVDWKKKWGLLNERLKQFSDKGLYLGDNKVSLFDIVAYPFFERLITIQHYAKYEILDKWMEEFPRVKSWYNTMQELEAVKKIKQKDEFFINGYKSYRERGEAAYKKEQEQKAAAAKDDK